MIYARIIRPLEHQGLEGTDLIPRTLLGSQGMKKGDLSKFIEQAVRPHVFHSTVQDIKASNVGTDPDALQALVDSTVRAVRAETTFRRESALLLARRSGFLTSIVKYDNINWAESVSGDDPKNTTGFVDQVGT